MASVQCWSLLLSVVFEVWKKYIWWFSKYRLRFYCQDRPKSLAFVIALIFCMVIFPVPASFASLTSFATSPAMRRRPSCNSPPAARRCHLAAWQTFLRAWQSSARWALRPCFYLKTLRSGAWRCSCPIRLIPATEATRPSTLACTISSCPSTPRRKYWSSACWRPPAKKDSTSTDRRKGGRAAWIQCLFLNYASAFATSFAASDVDRVCVILLIA